MCCHSFSDICTDTSWSWLTLLCLSNSCGCSWCVVAHLMSRFRWINVGPGFLIIQSWLIPCLLEILLDNQKYEPTITKLIERCGLHQDVFYTQDMWVRWFIRPGFWFCSWYFVYVYDEVAIQNLKARTHQCNVSELLWCSGMIFVLHFATHNLCVWWANKHDQWQLPC